ncbi:MAG: hypothetical protein ACRDD1_12170, partial [Planctomycetia bacterium]
MREVQAAVAVVQSPNREFLLVYNHEWRKYTFPTKSVDPKDGPMEAAVLAALDDDLGFKPPNATAEELDHVVFYGVSERTGEEGLYEYWTFAGDPGGPLNLPPAAGDLPPIWESYRRLLDRGDVSWTAKKIAETVVETQEAVVLVVTRPGAVETEYLLVDNPSYQGFVFPIARVKSELK